jgi:glucokinase
MNLARVWAALRQAGEITRPHLAERTELSRTTIAVLVDDLLAAGVLRIVGPGRSRGGRPADLLRLEPSACLAIGAAMTVAPPEIRLVLVDLDGRIVARATQRMAAPTPEALVDAFATGVDDLARIRPMARAGRAASAATDAGGTAPPLLLGAGFGATGVVEPATGALQLSVPLGWRDVPLAALLGRRQGLPVRVLSEDQAAALAEHSFGAARDARRLVYVGIGTGIGAGIILDGQVYGGAAGSAGELGHVTVLPDGPLCACGNHGCLEALAAEPQIIAQALRRLEAGAPSRLSTIVAALAGRAEPLTASHIAAAAAEGDALAGAVLEDAGRLVGITIAGVVNFLNPDAVVVGGGAVRPGGPLIAALCAEVERRALAYPLGKTRIMPASLGADTTAVGAACLILREAPHLIARMQDGAPATTSSAS